MSRWNPACCPTPIDDIGKALVVAVALAEDLDMMALYEARDACREAVLSLVREIVDGWDYSTLAGYISQCKYPSAAHTILTGPLEEHVVNLFVEGIKGAYSQDEEPEPCPVCGDTRVNPEGWECLGCGSI